MEDELTEAMHSEFTIDAETEIMHKVFSVWRMLAKDSPDAAIKKSAESYGITLEDAIKWKEYFF